MQLIGQILEYSRLDADAHEHRSNIDLGELLHSVVDDVRYEHGDPGSGVNIEFISEANCRTSGFPGALRSCFENVLRNAVQHGGGGDVRVQLAKDGSQAVVVVEDQGGGVPDPELAKIFEPFYRLAPTQDGARQSGGLGLAIAARAATLHGGAIRASNHSNGLRVEIRLPLASD